MWVAILPILALVSCVASDVRSSLNSVELDGTWSLENANGSIKTDGRVPGGVFSDLYDTGVLKESIYYRLNDQVYKWVGRDNWTYSRTFDVDTDVFNKQLINLVINGADTVADVVLNDVVIGRIDNMFLRYVFPIKDLIKPTGNRLEVHFYSPVTTAASRFAAQPHWYPPDCLDPNIVGECHINMLRKMPCSFGWDWGPPYASSGLWKPVEIEGTDSVILRDVTAQIEKGSTSGWDVTVTGFGELATEYFSGSYKVELRSRGNSQVLAAAEHRVIAKAVNNEFVITTDISVEDSEVSLWWPNGYGEQPLYELTVIVLPDGDTEVRKSVQVGFRTVEVVQDRIKPDVEGNTFYFKVNGVPIFAKGANWIPANLLPEKSYETDSIRHLLLSAKEANMNMFRIWGGGIYESDIFYQVADEVGILIWHDFMFSDAIYPVDDAFMGSVQTEVEQQVRRIQHHACIALWSGNNENESVLMWLFGNSPDLGMYQSDYRKLYIDTIKKTVDRLDPGRYYVGSSPSNGLIEPSVGYMHPDAGNALYGDSHYYNGGSDSWNPWSFPEFRFVSEFGYEGMNSFESIKKVSEPGDWTIGSNFSISRNRRDGTYEEISRLINYHLPLPEDDGSLEFFQLYIYYSQVTQAISIKTITEKFRRDRDTLTADNKGRTMGALYWMFNDVWQAPTWSSIEFDGRWKLLNYFATKFYAPALVSLAPTLDGHLEVFLVSDLKQDIPDLTLTVNVVSFASFEPKWSVTNNNIILSAGVSKSAWGTDSISDLLKTSNCEPATCFIHVALRNNTDLISDNIHFPDKLTDVQLPPANVKVEITETAETRTVLKLTAAAIAPFVWLETAVDGVFSDNGFTMTSAERTISFATRGTPIDQAQFAATLSVRDLSSPNPNLPLSSA